MKNSFTHSPKVYITITRVLFTFITILSFILTTLLIVPSIGFAADGALRASADGNTVNINGAIIDTNIYGGLSTSGSASNNTVNIFESTLNNNLYGGYTESGTANSNTVTIEYSNVIGDVYSGYGSTTTNNTVNIESSVIGKVYGGNSGSDNTLNMKGSSSIIGYVENFKIINLDGGTIKDLLNKADATMTIDGSGGTIDSFTNNGTTIVNNIGSIGNTANNGKVMFNLNANATYAGVMSGTGQLTKNGAGTLTLTGANTYSGGTTVEEGTLAGDSSSIQGNITNNGKVIFNQEVNGTYAGVMSGTGSLTKNGAGTLTLTGANTYKGGTTVTAGTLAGNSSSIQGNITNNGKVIFNQEVNGTYAGVMSGEGSLTKNGAGTLTLTGANTYRGGTTVSAGTLAGDSSSIQGKITNNGNVVFTQVANGTYAGVMSGEGSITKNGAGTLTLTGANTYSGGTTVSAGTLALGGGSLASKDLTLHAGTTFNRGSFRHSLNSGSLTINGAGANYNGDLSAAGATLNFLAPNSNDTPVLLNISGKANISNSVINLGIKGGEEFKTTTYTLIKSTGTLTAPGVTKGGGIAGLERTYTYELEVTPNSILAHTKVENTDSAISKSPSEGKVSASTAVNIAGDMVASVGISSAKAVSVKAASNKTATASMRIASFGAVSGGSSRYSTGSYVDLTNISLITGLAKTWQNKGQDVLGGVFFEAGWGTYTSSNEMANGGNFKARGENRYFGAGLLGRLDVTETVLAGIYAEASIRLGSLNTDYLSDELPGGNGERSSYDAGETYYGAHGGIGYLLEFNQNANLDIYGKYFWGHTTSTNVNILGSDVNMDAVNSHRINIGTRFNYAVNTYFATYVGLAWEYEFEGNANSVVGSTNPIAPSLTGNTGLGELGIEWKPVADGPFSIKIGAQGYLGKRVGGSGTAQIKVDF